jgi:methylmalonyl-CoA mutase N-terminal domain/subunit
LVETARAFPESFAPPARERSGIRDGLHLIERPTAGVESAADGAENTVPLRLDAVRAYATVGENCGALKRVFDTYQEKSIL